MPTYGGSLLLQQSKGELHPIESWLRSPKLRAKALSNKNDKLQLYPMCLIALYYQQCLCYLNHEKESSLRTRWINGKLHNTHNIFPASGTSPFGQREAAQ
eukprot:GHVP01036039.1.p1 GENE.GHVP01036039.1~~GHVP01036039.1.p1  ORF type:complete len:100 (-),score=3.83 GHVP01036039.1:387-686(-)